MDESYTVMQTMFYYRFVILNFLIATLVILSAYVVGIQTIKLIRNIVKDKREFKYDSFRCDNPECDSRERRSGDSIRVCINKSFNTGQSDNNGGD